MRLLPRKSGRYDGPVAFGQDGWHYPADRIGNDRFRLVAVGTSDHGTSASPDDAEGDGWRFARKDDRNHNAIHEQRVVELEGA